MKLSETILTAIRCYCSNSNHNNTTIVGLKQTQKFKYAHSKCSCKSTALLTICENNTSFCIAVIGNVINNISSRQDKTHYLRKMLKVWWGKLDKNIFLLVSYIYLITPCPKAAINNYSKVAINNYVLCNSFKDK